MIVNDKKYLILIDGSYYMHRAFHALPYLKTSKGEPTGAIYGIFNMLKKFLNINEKSFITIVFDSSKKTFRHILYPNYKANRENLDKNLQHQIKNIYNLIQNLGFKIIAIDGIEADDIIGTLAIKGLYEGLNVLIYSGDKDFAQLVNDNINIINNEKVIDYQGVKDKFGVFPEQIVDYLTLVGDVSDNIPGVKIIGHRTAVNLLEKYGSLINIIKQNEQIKGKIGENLRSSLEIIPIIQKLVKIKVDFDLKININDLILNNPDKDKLIDLFNYLEFKNFIKYIDN